MIRGTTPTITFDCDCDCTGFDLLEVAFSQADEVILTKKINDCAINGNKITVNLTEEDTLLFDCHKNPVQMQIRAGAGESRIASNIMHTTAEKILKDGCLE